MVAGLFYSADINGELFKHPQGAQTRTPAPLCLKDKVEALLEETSRQNRCRTQDPLEEYEEVAVDEEPWATLYKLLLPPFTDKDEKKWMNYFFFLLI